MTKIPLDVNDTPSPAVPSPIQNAHSNTRGFATANTVDLTALIRNINSYAARLGDTSLDFRTREGIATEIRDNLETLAPPVFRPFLEKLFPVFRDTLRGEPVFDSFSWEHKMRSRILEIIHRLPLEHPEVKPYATEMVDLMIILARVENEDNTVLSMKIVMDLLRRQAEATASQVQLFLDFILELFQNTDEIVRENFDTSPQSAHTSTTPGLGSQHPMVPMSNPSLQHSLNSPRPFSPASQSSGLSELPTDQPRTRVLLRGTQSFKVLAECPIIVVSLFQVHRSCAVANLTAFSNVIEKILMLQAKPQERAHEEAGMRGERFTGVSKDIRNRAAFGEFITAQVKTMSFLAYLLRLHPGRLQDFIPALPRVIVRLLQDCPNEKACSRKELLVALRHIISLADHRIFLSELDDLLDEKTLLGDGLTVHEARRPLAYSTLADLIHHIREFLSRDQIRRTIEVYTRNLLDDYPGTSVQTMSARLLLNLAPQIRRLEDKTDARFFLITILNAIGDKFAAMNLQYGNSVKVSLQNKDHPRNEIPTSQAGTEDEMPNWDETDIFSATPINVLSHRDRSINPVEDNKFLFSNLVKGLKGLFFQLKKCCPEEINVDVELLPANWLDVTFGFNAEEVEVIRKLFRQGVTVFRYYGVNRREPEGVNDNSSNQHILAPTKDEKDLLETFGTIFHCIDTATFYEVFNTEIPHLHELMFENSQLFHLSQFFLASEATSPAYAGMVLQYLMDRIDDIGTDDINRSKILLRMFKLSFMAVTLFPEQNEQVLYPHVSKIVTHCIDLSVSAKEPMNYFILLRSLFRSIGGGRFELLYKEILPLLEMLLEAFNTLLLGARNSRERDLYVELTLTVPARLSHLLPHLSYLMRPIVVALHSGPELVGQGLRTLELCVDNLTADYLDPIMAPVIDDLMMALWEQLKPHPYNHHLSHNTMRILGKLGGRNRRFLNHPPQLDYENFSDDLPSMDLRLMGTTKDRAFPVDLAVDFALGKLYETSTKIDADKATEYHYKQQAYHLISSQLKLYLGLEHPPENLAAILRRQASDLVEGKYDNPIDIFSKYERSDSVAKKDFQRDTLKKLLKGCIIAASTPSLKDVAFPLLTAVCQHLTIIDLGCTLAQQVHNNRPFSVDTGEGPQYLDPGILANAVVECLSSENMAIRDVAKSVMTIVRDCSRTIFGTEANIGRLGFFPHCSRIFCHACYSEEWFTKIGGTAGIQLLAFDLGLKDSWLLDRQHEYIRTLMFVVKDTPSQLSASIRNDASDTLINVLAKFNAGVDISDMSDPKSQLYNVCSFLVVESSHVIKDVRELAKKGIETLAKTINVEKWELVTPVKDKLLPLIFNKPLRALPFATQIGYIDAITYCLSLNHGVVVFNDQLTRLLMEVLALLDAEDGHLASKPAEYKVSQQIISFRVSCLRLLSLSMNFPEFASAPNNPARARVVSQFFNYLYSHSPAIIDAANTGLKDVITPNNNKLPKEILQNGLRPILMNLQDPKRLSVHSLDGLARLLTLLTNYFKVEIGARLLDHLKAIADDMTLQRASFQLLEQCAPMRVVVAIFNIFHLLPPAATVFMDSLVTKLLELETRLRRTTVSPFRLPIIKYLNRYPKETLAYFQDRFAREEYGRLFGQLLSEPGMKEVRAAIIEQWASFVGVAFPPMQGAEMNQNNQQPQAPPGNPITSVLNGILLLHSVCVNDPSNGLLHRLDLRQFLLRAGRELQAKVRADHLHPHERLRVEQAEAQLMDIFTMYLKNNLKDLDFLFDVIRALSLRQLKATLVFGRFIYSHIITNESVEYRRSIIMRCIDVYHHRDLPQVMKASVFKNLVNPIFAQDIQNTWVPRPSSKGNLDESSAISRPYSEFVTKPKLMDKSMADIIHDRIWLPQLGDISEESNQSEIDHTRIQILQLSALVVKYHHEFFQETRKDILKFAWCYIRLEDIIIRYGAYVLVSYFFLHNETPPKLIAQIYIALLKTQQNEGTALVSQALDIQLPIVKRVMGNPGDSRIPVWIKCPRRVLAEESANLQQVMSIFQFMVRQADSFYPYRELFIPVIVPSLIKINTTSSSSDESKRLALNLIGLLWKWEERRVREFKESTTPSTSSPKKRKMPETPSSSNDPAQVTPPQPPSPSPPYEIPGELRLAVVKYLMNFICNQPERYPVPSAKYTTPPRTATFMALAPGKFVESAVQFLQDFLSPDYWSDLNLDLYPKVLGPILCEDKLDRPGEKKQTDERQITLMVNALQVLRAVLAMKTDQWIMNNLDTIQPFLEKALRFENVEIQDCLHGVEDDANTASKFPPIVLRVLSAFPAPSDEDEDAMELDSDANEFLLHLNSIASEGLASNNLIYALNILWTLSKCRMKEIDQHVNTLLKVLSHKLAKDHVTAHLQRPQPLPSRHAEPSAFDLEFEINVDLISKSIDMISARMSHLGDQRRPFLSIVSQLIERSVNRKLCCKVLDMAEHWISDASQSFPTLKEKTAVLHKMLQFEQRADKVPLKRFLELIISIYEDPRITKTDLAVRLEQEFLIGTRAEDVEMRNRFMRIFDQSLSRSANARVSYVLTSQNWETLKESFWLAQASQLLFGVVDTTAPARLHPDDFTVYPTAFLYGPFAKDAKTEDVMVDDHLEKLVSDHRRFCQDLNNVRTRDIVEPLCQLQHINSVLASRIWVYIFNICWSTLSREERFELEKGIVHLATRSFHYAQLDDRPNVVSSIIEGCVKAKPVVKLPPHVLKFLSRTFDVWHTSAIALEHAAIHPQMDTPKIRESNLDALSEIYAGLQEEDLFYGTWRRRCKFTETNCALSFEQNGMWDKAQQLYEAAQIRARTGAVPFAQAEYFLWEDHWILCAEKLQQWELLTDFAKHENFNDLYIESTWRNIETWAVESYRDQLEPLIKSVSDAPTPRRLYFQAFMALLKSYSKGESNTECNLLCDEAIQLSIRKWHQLPKRINNAHIPILENFQLLVELHDANVICNSLAATTEANLDQKSAELKLLLGTWRDRLPNLWDDISAWQNLVSWRQHIFQLINATYLNLLPSSANNVASNSHAYRGYHETAWIINRFAHVARKHQMPETCINQLTRIYTLPNIEIQEAFLKLREQAKCHYSNPKELTAGLDVINNTNLNYFNIQQKAEFYTLKGMFLAKLSQNSEANEAFNHAIRHDLRLAKAWAEWGQYFDNLHKTDPNNIELSRNVVSCYLQAAGLYKSHKSRKLLSRILWFLSLDNAEGQVAAAFEEFNGETPVWYWITFIPQLLTGLQQPEARLCQAVLKKIAKLFPQALFFLLRTSQNDMLSIKRQHEQKERIISSSAMSTSSRQPSLTPSNAAAPSISINGTPMLGNSTEQATTSSPRAPPEPSSFATPTQGPVTGQNINNAASQPGTPLQPQQTQSDSQDSKAKEPLKKPWEYCEDVMSGLKTAFPLLALSMETMVDQIHARFKCPPEEDVYRLITALLTDTLDHVNRAPSMFIPGAKLPERTEKSVAHFAEATVPQHFRKAFVEDFVSKKLTTLEYVHKLFRWRNKLEEQLDRRILPGHLESYSSGLSEFKFNKFDEVEVPGQYLELKDTNKDFVHVDHFLPDVEIIRGVGVRHRRIKLRGHDGSLFTFAVQHPAARHSRREERILQLFRIFNSILAKKKESRRRNLYFKIPLVVPLAPHVRLVQNDASYVTLQAIYEDYCRRVEINKDQPVIFTLDKVRSLAESKANPRTHELSTIICTEIFTAIQQKYVPNTLVLEYFQQIYPSFSDFFLFRRQFSYQYAAVSFMTHIMFMGNRLPSKISISQSCGDVWSADMVPFMHPAKPLFFNPETVPFRLTPNIHTLMGPIFTEGIYSCAIMAIARCLTEPRHDLEQQLSIFVRDEMLYWSSNAHRFRVDTPLRERVQANTELIVTRAVQLATPSEGTVPANQAVIDMISRAVNPHNLAQCDALWMPYL